MVDAIALLAWAPEPVRRWIGRVASGQGITGRFADRVRFRLSGSRIPDLPPLRDAPRRLLIGPANSAGQGYEWARAVEREFPQVQAFAMQGIGDTVFRYAADISAPVAVYQRSDAWHASFEDYLTRHTHVIWESGLPLLGRKLGSSASREIDLLRRHGVAPALLFHGSDIRPPARHAATSQWSPFYVKSGQVMLLEEGARRNAEMARAANAPVFVSTPDLLQWLPEAAWSPVVVAVAEWRHASDSRLSVARARPVVVHAPSLSWLKGTSLVEPILRRLDAEGVIEYRQITGVAHAEMPQIYADADIVLDQFVLGIYGVAAVEALAAGCVVMSHVDAFTRRAVRDLTGLELPIHEVTPATLERELRRAVREPDTFDGLRAAGPAFVEAVHDGRRSAAAFAPFLELSA